MSSSTNSASREKDEGCGVGSSSPAWFTSRQVNSCLYSACFLVILFAGLWVVANTGAQLISAMRRQAHRDDALALRQSGIEMQYDDCVGEIELRNGFWANVSRGHGVVVTTPVSNATEACSALAYSPPNVTELADIDADYDKSQNDLVDALKLLILHDIGDVGKFEGQQAGEDEDPASKKTSDAGLLSGRCGQSSELVLPVYQKKWPSEEAKRSRNKEKAKQLSDNASKESWFMVLEKAAKKYVIPLFTSIAASSAAAFKFGPVVLYFITSLVSFVVSVLGYGYQGAMVAAFSVYQVCQCALTKYRELTTAAEKKSGHTVTEAVLQTQPLPAPAPTPQLTQSTFSFKPMAAPAPRAPSAAFSKARIAPKTMIKVAVPPKEPIYRPAAQQAKCSRPKRAKTNSRTAIDSEPSTPTGGATPSTPHLDKWVTSVQGNMNTLEFAKQLMGRMEAANLQHAARHSSSGPGTPQSALAH